MLKPIAKIIICMKLFAKKKKLIVVTHLIKILHVAIIFSILSSLV